MTTNKISKSDKLRAALGGVSLSEMQGDNLAIALCTFFENPDQEEDEETHWTPDAIKGCDRTLDAIHAHYAAYIAELENKVEAENLARIQAENTRLRAALANSELPCVYCTLSSEDWAKCQYGFPGCDRADDAMGCPELGARLELEQLKEELAALKTEVKP
jgi:hypothetical protein